MTGPKDMLLTKALNEVLNGRPIPAMLQDELRGAGIDPEALAERHAPIDKQAALKQILG